MEKRLHILQAIDEFLPHISGAVRAVDNYSKNLAISHDVTVVTQGEAQDIYNYLPYTVIYGNSFNTLKKKLSGVAPDIIHVHSSGKILDYMLSIANAQNIPIVATIHSDSITKIIMRHGNGLVAKLKIKKLIAKYNKLTEVFVFSPYVAEHLREYGFSGKVSYLPLASDLDSDTKRAELLKIANEKYGLDPETNVLISIGNLRKTKRLDFALKSLAIAKRKGLKFKYFVVGKGEEQENLAKLTKEYGMTKDVNFLGYVPDENLIPLIARADLLLLPTTYDLFGLAKVECAGFATAGLYIMDSFVANEVFDDINGYLSKNTEEEYSQKILEIFSNKAKLKEVSSSAYTDLYITWDKATFMLHERLSGVVNENTKLRKKLK